MHGRKAHSDKPMTTTDVNKQELLKNAPEIPDNEI